MQGNSEKGDGDVIEVRGAREHNLQDVCLRVPKHRLVVVTGPSGSGKSSLVFDTIHAEGQRRFFDALSLRARRALGELPRADCDGIKGLSPTIALEQRPPRLGRLLTVGGLVEVADLLAVLYGRLSVLHCPACDRPVEALAPSDVATRIEGGLQGQRLVISSHVRGGAELRDSLIGRGFGRAIVQGAVVDLGGVEARAEGDSSVTALDVVVDRVIVKPGGRQRLIEAIETAYTLGEGKVRIHRAERAGELELKWTFSREASCDSCEVQMPARQPSLFDHRHPLGACHACDGVGGLELGGVRRFVTGALDDGAIEDLTDIVDALVADASLGLAGGAIPLVQEVLGADAWGKKSALGALMSTLRIPIDVPVASFRPSMWRRCLFGPGRGRRDASPLPGLLQVVLEGARSAPGGALCEGCGGTRMHAAALSARLGGVRFRDVVGGDVDTALAALGRIDLQGNGALAAADGLAQIRARLRRVAALGLGYLGLQGAADGLSAGEFQRLRLSSRLGGELSGVTYLLDEPSTGLHPADVPRLVTALRQLVEEGNSVIAVEHDPGVVAAADWVIALGPGAGPKGGLVVYEGSPQGWSEPTAGLRAAEGSAFNVLSRVGAPAVGRGVIEVSASGVKNLRGVEADFPIAALSAIVGPSGAGKSALLLDALRPGLQQAIGQGRSNPVESVVTSLAPDHGLGRVVVIEATPFAQTGRGMVVTWLGVYDALRRLFAATSEARAAGFTPARFGLGPAGGRCLRCRGEGSIRLRMQVLPDVFATCDACGGRRFDEPTLSVRYRGLSIAEALALRIGDARVLFSRVPQLGTMFDTLSSVGLDYLLVGQPLRTISGGEAQRLRLARDLGRPSLQTSVYLIDEPCQGLSGAEVDSVLGVLRRLVDAGHTVVVSEHDMRFVRACDHIVELGPGGGPAGGQVVARGTPAAVASAAESVTGRHLADLLAPTPS